MLEHAAQHAGEGVPAEQVLATIEAMSRVARRGESRKASDKKTTEAAWRRLAVELRRCIRAGEPPSSPRARAVARAARERLNEFAGGDDATLDALAHLRRVAPPESFGGWTPPMFFYLDEALANLAKKEKER